MWFVIYEYEIYNNTKPIHQWTCVGTHQHKDKAIAQALEENFNQFCKNQVGRWPLEFKGKKTLSSKDKEKIVSFVLNNINSKTGSENDWNGTGYWIVSNEEFKLPENKQNGELIDDIFMYFEDSEGDNEGDNEDDNEGDKKGNITANEEDNSSEKEEIIAESPKLIKEVKKELPVSRPRRSSVDSIKSNESGLADEFSDSDLD